MVTTIKAHQTRPIQAVSLTPVNRRELVRLHEAMERDKDALLRRFAEEIAELRQDLAELERQIEQTHQKIEGCITMRAQMMRQGCTETAQKLVITMQEDNGILTALQTKKDDLNRKIRDLEGRRDGLGLT